MKVSRAVVEENRKAIVEAAGRLFRERGFDGVSVADVMRAAGLTHGAFYGYFESKQALAATACEHALKRSVERWSGTDLNRIVRDYLSPAHRDAPAEGCTLAALAGEAARTDGAVKDVFTRATRDYVDLFVKLEKDGSVAARRQRALATLASMIGALVLARAMGDETLSNEILSATRKDRVSG